MERQTIIEELGKIVPSGYMVTDETILKEHSVDRFRKFEKVFGVYSVRFPRRWCVPGPLRKQRIS